jgi:chromosome segregation ATPase
LKGAAELDGLRHDFSGMEARAAKLKADSSRPSFIELQDLQSDPLNARAGMDSLKRGLQAWAASLDELERVRVNAEEAVHRARHALGDLSRLSDDYQAHRNRLKELFGQSAETALKVTPDVQTTMLSSWCETLETMLIAGQWNAVNVGAGRLNAALIEAIGNVNRAIAEANTRCASVDELKGQFVALRAKEKALLGPGASNDTSAALREQIDQALAARPIDIDVARALLQQYQNILLASGRR